MGSPHCVTARTMDTTPYPPNRLTWRSLAVRLTTLTLAVTLCSLWALTAYLLDHVDEHMHTTLGAHQRDVVALHGNSIEAELAHRLNTAERVTRLFDAELMTQPAALQDVLEDRPLLPTLFSGGYFVTDSQGVAIASYPASLGRVGMSYIERDHIAHALQRNASKISKPVTGKLLKQPVVSFAAPIRGADGKPMGAFVGVTDLSKPNFLDGILQARYGQTGRYTLLANDWELVVTRTDRHLSLQPIPQLELGPELSRLLTGKADRLVLRNPQGQNLLATAQHIPSANWTLLATIPSDEVFAPVAHIRQTLLLATLLVSVMAALGVFWLLKHQLEPMAHTARQLASQTRGDTPFQLLPPGRQDEVGQLINSFNALLAVLFQRQAQLNANERALTETTRQLEQAQAIAQLGNWSFGIKDQHTTWSKQMYAMFHLDPNAFEPSFDTFLARVHRDDRAMVDAALQAALTTGAPHQLEHRVVLPGGQVKWLSQRGQTELDADGQPIRLVGTVQDITARKLAEAELTHSHDLLKNVMESIPMRVFWKGTDLRYLGCNIAFAYDAGKTSPAEVIGRSDHELGWAAQADLYRSDDMAVMASGTPRLQYEEQQTTPDGHTIWLRTSKIPLKNRQQAVTGVLGVYEDITQQKHDTDHLRKLSLVAEHSPFGIAITDPQERFEYVNPAYTRKTGYTAAELLGNTPRMLHSGMNDPAVYTQMWARLKTGQMWEGEIINRRRDGSTYVDRSIITPLRAGDAEVTHYVSVQEDITLQKQTAAELARYQAQLEDWVAQRTYALSQAEYLNEQALDLAKAGAWSADFSEGRAHITSSARGIDILGLTPNLDYRYAVYEDMYLPAAAADRELADAALKGYEDTLNGEGSTLDLTFPYQRPADHRIIWLHVRGDISRNELGKATQVHGVMMDITAAHTAEALLQTAKAQAEAANRAKSDFLANMSHEIRTPLNAISGMARLIGQGELSDEQRSRLNKLEMAGSHLLRTIDNILDLSKIEVGKFDLATEAVQVQDTVDTVLTILADRAKAKQLTLTAHSEAQPAPLVGDQTRLTQALLNLATNAVKFTEIGSVAIHVRVLADASDHVLWRFEVQDTGMGIAPDAQQRLFKSFEQLDASTTRQFGGTGLGLAITQHIARLMGGDAGVESAVGKGSLFWFTARLAKAAPMMQAVPDSSALPEDWAQTLRTTYAGQQVLVAEDDAFNQEIALMLVQDVGLVADLADNGQAAVARFEAQTYDLVLMDMQMPLMDGLEATRRIRQLAHGRSVPIVALTGNVFADDRERCLTAGMNDFVTKPIDPDTLYRAMVNALRSRETAG